MTNTPGSTERAPAPQWARCSLIRRRCAATVASIAAVALVVGGLGGCADQGDGGPGQASDTTVVGRDAAQFERAAAKPIGFTGSGSRETAGRSAADADPTRSTPRRPGDAGSLPLEALAPDGTTERAPTTGSEGPAGGLPSVTDALAFQSAAPAPVTAVPVPSETSVPARATGPGEVQRNAAPAGSTPAPAPASTPTAPPAPPPVTVAAPVAPTPVAAATPTTAAPVTIAYDTTAESQLLALVNDARAAVGAPPLQLDGSLRAAARTWAVHLQAVGSLAHQPLEPFLGPFDAVGENVAFAYSTDAAHQALMASAGHYANIVNPPYRAIGIGIVVDPDGRLWVCELFGG